MLRMPSRIELYEEMCLLSSRMAAAARAGAWETLKELEQRVAGLRERLASTAGDGKLPAADLARKHNLIQRILETDAEVRRHTEPWMEQLSKLLSDSARRRDILKAYAASVARSAPGSRAR